ncbi:hypothetical protein AHiyo8_56770 [Arthrobacter sp. Hiyo8]|nr:hypothetical protein AHiyo8_56770 [Arthrobacter sp. Hiyo8]
MRSPRVEAQNRDAGQRRKPIGRLPVDVRIHESAVRWQGCRVIRVAEISPDSGSASSPTSNLPSSVRNSTFSRCAGKTVDALMSVADSGWLKTREAGSKLMLPSLSAQRYL